jgi:hypothetical protein
MSWTLKLAIATVSAGTLAAAHALPTLPLKFPKLNREILSVPNLNLHCDSPDTTCHVTVKVEPFGTDGCRASVDYDHVIVKKRYTSMSFELAKSSMIDGSVYEFVDEGVAFPSDLNPGFNPKDSLEFITLGPDKVVAHWRSLKKRKADIHYVPVVRRVSPTSSDCEAHDPKINNDGG